MMIFLLLVCAGVAIGAKDKTQSSDSPKKKQKNSKQTAVQAEQKKASQDAENAALTQDMNRILQINESLKVEYQRQAGEILKINQQIQNTNQILKIILQLQKTGATSILVTHDMHAIFKVTDRVAFLRDGKIRTLGTSDDIEKTTDPVVKSFITGETM